METIHLKADKREIKGKQVKKLRKQGLLPVSVFGKEIKSEMLSLPMKEFAMVYSKAGETGLIELEYNDKKQHVLISNVQIHPVTREMLHAELHAVKLTDKIKANVPIEISGESPAVKDGLGVLIQTLNEIEVEALPTKLPDMVAAVVDNLNEVGQQVKVADLKVPEGVEVLTDGEEIVINVAPAVAEETAKEIEAEEAAKVSVEGEEVTSETEGEETKEATSEEKKD